MDNRIALALSKLFAQHRIIFWNDEKKELRKDFDALSIPNVEKIELNNNEYGVKYKILRESPKQKFLLYREGPQPTDLNNWLLDVQLAQGVFRTDQVAIWLSELELGLEFAAIVQMHAEFFHANKRIEALKKLLHKEDTASTVQLKILAVTCSSEPRIDTILESLLQELAEGRDVKIQQIMRYKLDGFLWDQLQRQYAYQSEEPSIHDFAIELFKSCYAMATSGAVNLNPDALVFLKRWKDSRQFAPSFEKLSEQCAVALGIEDNLNQRDFRDLLMIDYFQLIDLKIINDLVLVVTSRTASSADISSWVRDRRHSHWFAQYEHLYEAIDHAASFIHTFEEISIDMPSFAEGIKTYSTHWYILDQLYRKFIYHTRKSVQVTLLDNLKNQIENLYINNYVLKLGDRFQEHVDKVSTWITPTISLQRNFFTEHVQPFLDKGNKVCVIISDAMRYEVGEELTRLIQQEDRYTANMTPALAMLPSYTQLGMAALLPNKELSISDRMTGSVLIDGQSSLGTANRTKILQTALNGRGLAIAYQEFIKLNRDEARDLIKANDVVYFYHNRIDDAGDKTTSENDVFDAVEQTFDELITLLKKLTSANVSNVLITADHGFLYQDRDLEESDFSSVPPQSTETNYSNRRFVLGTGMKPSSSLHTFNSEQLGLTGDMEIQLPKSINRWRRSGATSRFVHGGATLQEVLIPIIKVNKARQSNVSHVEVDILRSPSSIISSGQLVVSLYQTEAVTDKMQTRQIRAGIYTESDKLISDMHELSFDIESENPRDREQQLRFILTNQANAYNGQDVILKLKSKIPGTSQYLDYKSQRYTLRRSFTSDFEF